MFSVQWFETHFVNIFSLPSKPASQDLFEFSVDKGCRPQELIYHDESTLWKHSQASTGPNELMGTRNKKYDLIFHVKEWTFFLRKWIFFLGLSYIIWNSWILSAEPNSMFWFFTWKTYIFYCKWIYCKWIMILLIFNWTPKWTIDISNSIVSVKMKMLKTILILYWYHINI